jgi:putative transposase
MTMWLAAPDLAGLPGMPSTPRSVLRRAQSEQWETRPREGRGRSGFEYLATSLPAETQQAIAARAAGAVRPIAEATKAGAQAKRAAQVQACADSMARYGIQLESRGGFDPASNPRLDLFQRFETYHRTRGGAVWPAIIEFCALWSAGGIEALPNTKSSFPALPAKTLDKWYRAWRVSGVEALLERKPRKDKGRSRLTEDEALYEVFVAALAEMHDPTARQVRRVIVDQLGEQRAPAAGTLKRWLREFKVVNKVALLRFKNPDGYKNSYRASFGSISEDVKYPNQRWELDSTIADAMLVDPQTGEIRRHAIISCIDIFTRRVKFLVARTSSANGIKSLLRRCMIDWGKPECVKTDNGKDYLAQDLLFALQALAIQHDRSTPFSPEQKGHIERVQGTMLHDLFPMIGGFVGHSIEQRKAIESAKSFAERFGQKNAVIEFRLSPQQLQDAIDGWVNEYHGREHSSLGCAPTEMADRHTTHVLRVDERALDLLLMPVAGTGTRQVTKQGIHLGNAWFRAPELASVHVMGSTVRCRQDDADMGALHVFALDGTYICRALDYSLLNISRAELAAKARAIEGQTLKPFQQAMQQAKRKGFVREAARSIYVERQAEAADQAANVKRLQPRVVMESTPAIESVIAAHDPSARDAAREAARASLEAPAAPVAEVAEFMSAATPNAFYSAWVRLQVRKGRGEQISQRELDWARSYESSSEFAAWHQLHEGQDPLAESTG